MAATPSHSPTTRSTTNGHSLHPYTAEEYLTGFKKQFDFALETMATLFLQKDGLEKELGNLRLDLENTIQMNRDLRKQNSELMAMVEERNHALTHNNYTLVLIDGDGMTFRRDLLKEGRAGGEKAANRLRTHVVEDTGFKPIIRVYANVEGLSRAMKTQGLVQNFREFTVGVSDACQEQIDFIDVGEGKEMADTKLKSELEWHLKNYNCRSIVLGVSHDNGYARVLKRLENERENFDKIYLLEGPPFGRELEALRFKRIKYEDVFSSEKFDVYNRSPVLTAASPVATKAGGPVTSYASAVTAAPMITPPSSTGHASPRLQKAQPTFTESQIQEAIRKIKSLRPKPCNNFYLKRECSYGDDECTFGHKYPLKDVDIAAMRRLAQQKQCNFGKECINERCYYSHDDA